LFSLFQPNAAHAWQSAPEYGKASYYGEKLQGRKTASGQKYDKKKFTCAHKTHPFGTMLRVTRVDDNRSVLVTVNDRGPFAEGRVVDVSGIAAERLGMVKEGIIAVKIEVVSSQPESIPVNPAPITTPVEVPASKPTAQAGQQEIVLGYTGAKPISATTSPAATSNAAASEATAPGRLYKIAATEAPKQGYAVQLSNLSQNGRLLGELSGLVKKWPGKIMVSQTGDLPEFSSFRLLIGPFPDRATADKFKAEAAKKGYPKCFVVELGKM
jgi:rare lipoprotein A